MKKSVINVMAIAFFAIAITGCRKKAFDDYYGAPSNLAAPIYQVLQAKGNFKSLLACIDKSGYKDILNSAGYWTMFAPDDSAFIQFFKDRGIAGTSQIDSGTAAKIVTYSLVYNSFAKARLADYQSATGWVPGLAFKRRTANYRGFYQDTTAAGQPVTALSANRNGSFVLGDNNNKYIPYFLSNFLTTRGITAYDYNYFYPNTTYTGFNVANATVVASDIPAQNGYIHEIDKVIMPLPSIDQYLAANPQYSEFKKLFDKYMVSFVLNADATSNYKNITGLSNSVYIKEFNSGLVFSPNNENYLKLEDNDAQKEGWSMLVPTNAVLDTYLNNVILQRYGTLDALPPQVLIDFLNSQMWQSTMWPSLFANTNNSQGQAPTISPTADVVDKQVLSNGVFYGTSKVHESNLFRTVFGKAYLDPKYSLMTRALNQAPGYGVYMQIPNVKYTVFMLSDKVLRARGYDYNTLQSQWQYTIPGTTTVTISATVAANLQRIIATSIVQTPNNELETLAGSGIIATLGGEIIKWNANTVYSAGAQDSGYVLHIDSTATAYNGRVYYVDNLLTYSTNTLGNHIKALGSATTSDYNYYYQFLSNSSLFNATTGDVGGVQLGVFYTAFVPNNAAIQAAVNAGLLPTTGVTNGGNLVPNFNPTVQSDRALVASFIQYHIVNKTTVIPDGLQTGNFPTLYTNLAGNPDLVNVSSTRTPAGITVTDNYGRTSHVIIAGSNNLADRCVIHLIDNYLQYTP